MLIKHVVVAMKAHKLATGHMTPCFLHRHRRELEKKNLLLEEAQTQTSSPGGSSIRSGFKRVSTLLAAVPMPMSMPRRRSVTVLQVRFIF